MQKHNGDTIKMSKDTSLEKYTSHFIWKGCVWEGVGDWTELQHIDPYSYGDHSLSFGGVRGAMVIVAGYGHGDTSSNPGPDWLHFTLH